MKKSTRQLLIVAAVVAALVAVDMYSQRTPKEEREDFTVDISMNAIKIFGIVMGVLAAITIILYFGITYMEKRSYNAAYAKYAASRPNIAPRPNAVV